MPFSVVKWLSEGAGRVGATNEIQRPARAGRSGGAGGERDRSTSFSLFHLMLTAPSF